MTEDVFNEIIGKLDLGSISMHEMYDICIGRNISYKQAEQFLYSFSIDRSKRFELFIILYEASLKHDDKEAYRTFREAYCASDNIYAQVKDSQYKFDVKIFLSLMQNRNINFLDFMNEDEKSYYDSLPEILTIYRGMNNAEYETQNYGISWTLSEDIAKQYIYFDKNKVQEGSGGLVNIEITKDSIITVFSVNGVKEIIYLH